jgi:hypothetical protein
MKMVLNYCPISNSPQPPTLPITSMSGVGDVVYAKQKPPSSNVLTGFSDHLSLSSAKMLLPPSHSPKKKPSVKPSNMTSFMHNRDTCTQYSPTFPNLCHSAKTNLGCLIQQTDLLVLPCIIVHNPNHHRCMGLLNTHQRTGALRTTPHPITSSHTLLLHLHPLVDRHRHLPYICLFQTQVVPPPHHLIVQVKAPRLPMYLMEPHHHRTPIFPFPDLHNLWLPHIPIRG